MNKQLSILQYNVNKSREQVMAPLLADENTWEYDIIAIQEPWRNKFQTTTYHPIKDRFDLVYNTHRKTRVCFFINRHLKGTWSHIHHTPDLDSLHLQIQDGDQRKTLHIHNIYNPIEGTENRQSTLPDLRKALEEDRRGEHLIVGDFNLHHPMWAGTQLRRSSIEAGDLLEIIMDYHLELLLPVGTKTRQEQGEPSTIDLVFGTQQLVPKTISCDLAGNELDHDSNYLLITTLLEMSITTYLERKRWL